MDNSRIEQTSYPDHAALTKPINQIIARPYRLVKVGLNYLLDRNIELDNLILMDYFSRKSPQRWQLLKRIVRRTGSYAALLQDLPRLPAVRLTGEHWSVVYVGRGQHLLPVKNIFFDGPVEACELGRFPVWALPRLHDQWEKEGVGLVIQEMSQAHHPGVKGKVSFRSPTWVQQIVALPRSVDDLFLHPEVDKDFRRQVKKIKQMGFVYSYSYSREDFDFFYHQLYLPFISNRHGDNALITPYSDMLRWFKRGGLLLLHHFEQKSPVGGVVTYMAGDTGYAVEAGFIEDDFLWRQGINAFLYWSALHWAVSHKAKYIDLGGSFPARSNGVFFQKKRWGAQVERRKRIYSMLELVAGQMTLPLEQYLNEMGLIAEIKGRYYQALINTCGQFTSPSQLLAQSGKAIRDGLAGIAVFKEDESPLLLPGGIE